MGRVRADTFPTIGFRTYGQTNPFRAAHLSAGARASEQGAWPLHGLGQDAIDYSNPAPVPQDVGAQDTTTLPPVPPVTDATVQAVHELEAAGQLDPADGDLILNGEASFSDILGYDPTQTAAQAKVQQQIQNIESPPGTRVSYYAKYATGLKNFGFVDACSTVNYLRGALQKWNLVVEDAQCSSSAVTAFLGQPDFTIVVRDDIGHASFNDIRGIIDSELQNYATTWGGNLISSRVFNPTVPSGGALPLHVTATGTQPQPQAPSLTTWLMQNWTWIALAGIALVVAGPLTEGLFGRRRR